MLLFPLYPISCRQQILLLKKIRLHGSKHPKKKLQQIKSTIKYWFQQEIIMWWENKWYNILLAILTSKKNTKRCDDYEIKTDKSLYFQHNP